MDFLLGLLCAALITHLFAALSFPALWRSRPRQVYFAQFGLHSFVMAVRAPGGDAGTPGGSTLSDDRRDRIEALRGCSRERIV